MQVENYVNKRNETIFRIKEMMAKQLNLDLTPEKIDNDAPLFGAGLGLDSVDALELIVGIEQEFDLLVEEGQKSIFRSVNTIADYVLKENA
jgi:acyl carrier protein